VPRKLALRRLPEGIRLVQAPIAELKTLRATSGPSTITAAGPVPGSADIEMDLTRGEWRDAGIRLSNAAGEAVVVGVSANPLELFVDRRTSRATPFHREYPGRHAGPVRWRGDTIALRVLFDRSVIEVFANDGESVITERVYPTQPLDRIELLPGGGATSARVWEMRSVWPQR
jgi:sucrose-6-phosphate hydrolase SacC (GH32 family)